VRLYTPLGILLLIASGLCGQSKKIENHSYFDLMWNPTDEKQPTYHVRHVREGDSVWRVDTYKYFGPIIKTGTYKDEQAKIPHGMLAWYNAKGKLDSARDFYEGLPHGEWTIYDDTVLVEVRTYYRGAVIKVVDAETFRDGYRIQGDSAREYGKESVFPGGEQAWQKYLNRAKYPGKAVRREIQGGVKVKFIVGPSGYVTEAFLDESVAMLLDDQLLQIIKNSPRWEPATINGRPVNSYKIQTLYFGFPEERRRAK
jgi:periplasmic protein TonB